MGVLSDVLAAELKDQALLITTIKLNGASFRIGSTPLSPSDFSFVNRIVKPEVPFQRDPTNFDGMIAMLVRKAHVCSEDGELGDKAWDIKDKVKMSRLGIEIVSGIFNNLFGEQVTEHDEDDIEDDGISPEKKT